MKGKVTHASFPASKSRWAKSVLGLVHSDLWEPSPVTSIDGMHYMLTLTDDKSQWLWVIFLKSKGEALKAFVDWLVYVEKETGLKLCMIHTENISPNSGTNFSRNVVYAMNSLCCTLLSKMESLSTKTVPSLTTSMPF